ncbi:MAG: hypothetical protein DI629_03325 [Mesorhizobium amorphae]|nr:MAG: hypothetical protein DI629_03325 [Mesorhizobium amorphae]
MNIFVSIVIAAKALLFVSLVLFSDPFALLNFAFVLNGRLGVPAWQFVALLGVAAGSSVFFQPMKRFVPPILRPAAFAVFSVILALVFVGFYVEVERRRLIAKSDVDAVVQHSFFRSVREVPREYQFFLHAAALKNCSPLAWSYRRMEFYDLPAGVAPHVIPDEWRRQCNIELP